MRDSGRNLLHVVGDEDRGWCVVILGELAQGVDQRLAPGKVQARSRLVQQQQLRIGHQGPSDLHPLAFPLAQCAECAIRQSVDAQLREQLVGSLVIELVVLLTPPAEDCAQPAQQM